MILPGSLVCVALNNLKRKEDRDGIPLTGLTRHFVNLSEPKTPISNVMCRD